MRAAVLGAPVAHSLSPVLHRAAYAALGLPWTYDACEVDGAGLAGFLAGLDASWAGLSLTMPLKERVLPLLTTVTDLARDVAAANTVVRTPDGALHGHNTDVHGLVAALGETALPAPRTAVVLGGGATARSALAALRAAGDPATILVVRSDPATTLEAARRLGRVPTVLDQDDPAALAAVQAADLVVSTLPAGAADRWAVATSHVPVVLDVVYAGWPTALASAAAAGGVRVSGLRMLLHQAAAQVTFMTGHEAPVGAMDAALRKATGGR